jgi:ATP-dependent RNA helicase DHR2
VTHKRKDERRDEAGKHWHGDLRYIVDLTLKPCDRFYCFFLFACARPTNRPRIEMPKVQAGFDGTDRLPDNKKRKRSHQSLRPHQTDPRNATDTKESIKDGFSKSSGEFSKSNPAPKLDTQERRPQPKSTPGNQLKAQRDSLLKFRRALPIWPYASQICASLRGSKNVMILVGETGSGKSTQVPQFLLQERWCSGCVAITQPRRVAAVSLARRVAQEMGSPLGAASPASRVGYSVRFDTSVSPGTRVKFLTEGMLLQEMLRDPYLLAYSVVVVDEVHERSVNVDLLLGFLRNLAVNGEKGRKGKRLKIVVMSATADVDALVKFFRAGFTDSDGCRSELKSPLADGPVDDSRVLSQTDSGGKESHSDRVTACHITGRLFPVKVIYLQEPTQNFVESALKCIFQIHYKEPLPGDILVFLTGQDTVESLERLVIEYAKTMDSNVPKVRISWGFQSLTVLDSASAALRGLASGTAAKGVSACSGSHSKDHFIDQHCRDLGYRSRSQVCSRQRKDENQAVS